MNQNLLKSIKESFLSSVRELRVTHTIVLCGILGAMAAVLRLVTSIQVGPYIQIGFSWIPSRIVDYMFGPTVGIFFGAVMDIVKYLIKPMGAFDIRFTLVPMASGMIYGLILYKKPVSIVRIFIAKLIVTVLLNIGANTYLISTTMGKGFLAILPGRVIKNLISLPVDTIILFVVLTAISNLLPRLKSNQKH